MASMDSNGLSDPYCLLCLVAPDQAKEKTEQLSNNRSFRNLSASLFGFAAKVRVGVGGGEEEERWWARWAGRGGEWG